MGSTIGEGLPFGGNFKKGHSLYSEICTLIYGRYHNNVVFKNEGVCIPASIRKHYN